MNRKAILGISIATIFAVGAIIAFSTMNSAIASSAPWQFITPGSVGITPKNTQTTQLTLTTGAAIPDPSPILEGFAWLYVPTSGPDSAFAITSHSADLDGDGKNDVRDSNQKKDGFHAHNVVLTGVPPDTDGVVSTFCVATISDAPNTGISIEGSAVKVNVKNSDITGTFAGIAAGFDIVVDTDCPITVPTPSVVPGGLPLGIIVHSLTA